MRAQDENRAGKDRRLFDQNSITPREVNRRWGKERRASAVDEHAIYDTETTTHEDLWALSQTASRW